MRNDSFETLRSIDPAAGPEGGWRSTRAERDELLRGVLRTRAAEPAPRKWRWPLAGLAVATSLAVAVSAHTLLGPDVQPAQAVTPEPLSYQADGTSPKAVLARLAAAARKDTYTAPADADLYFKNSSWSLSSQIDGIRVTSAILPEQRETWRKPDGSMTWKNRTLPPQFQDPRDEEVWQDAGSVGEDPLLTEDSTGPLNRNDPLNRPAPYDARAMGAWLFASQEYQGTGELFDSVAAHHLNELWNGRQRAAMLDFLATRPDIQFRGSVTDRAGRTGQAVSVDSAYAGLPTRYTLIFDRNDGKLLAYEEELTTRAGALNVKVPSVISYVCYLTARPA
ncbi:CU044_5270 family protein [Streptomyces candidus]|uniref:CU044_5270 family protein n=1 Tax=Streptomyces candidus TaxID=67283 RepID=A0A7X0HD88_9ACTN|nr:CU044_5270 family protein [Streptomyces candidus]MBB6435453.1 hypothetical protein [Streptomyces candidus]GHH47417.1 hypothetical protein GCM10018773_40020 [Streptomyces candidus]